jgi:hypothetical protein
VSPSAESLLERNRRFGVRSCGANTAAFDTTALRIGLRPNCPVTFDVSTYEGRGIAITGSTALLSQEDSTTRDEVNLATHQPAGELSTAGGPAGGFGALSLDQGGKLWGAKYSATEGNIDVIGGDGAVHTVFNAAELDPEDTYIDGLAAAPDGTFWVSGEGLRWCTSPTATQ